MSTYHVCVTRTALAGSPWPGHGWQACHASVHDVRMTWRSKAHVRGHRTKREAERRNLVGGSASNELVAKLGLVWGVIYLNKGSLPILHAP